MLWAWLPHPNIHLLGQPLVHALIVHSHSHTHTHAHTHTHSNIAEALISKGLATCLRHRQDDDQRSSCYDDLMAAEARALKNAKGVHSKKDAPIHRVADVSQVS